MLAKPKAVIGLDCAIGKDGAGVAGLWYYEALGIPSAAVDVMTWLYKGAYSCAYELGLD